MHFLGVFLHEGKEDCCRSFLSFFTFVYFILFSVLSVLFDVEFDCKMVFACSIHRRPISTW